MHPVTVACAHAEDLYSCSITAVVANRQGYHHMPCIGKGRMTLVKTFIYHNGALVDVAQLRNRSSP